MATPFSEFTRIIGRGPTLSRALTRDEARDAMAMILEGGVDRLALGGFLLVLRQRGETSAEIAGFVDAVRARLSAPRAPVRPDVDWPAYADKHRQQPWFVLAALLLANIGIRVLMHGIEGEHEGCAPTRPVLRSLGISSSPSLGAAADAVRRRGFAYVGLESFAPETERLFHLKPVLGVRSIANTFVRDINPLRAPLTMVGIVHPAYRPLHAEALDLLGQDRAVVFKGIGGEVQRNPYKATEAETLNGGCRTTETWPAALSGETFLWRKELLTPDRVAALWHGGARHPAAEASIIATAALALKALGRAPTQEAAMHAAETAWRTRLSDAASACFAV